MKMCYVDESGDTGPFDPGERNSQPIFLLCALMLDQGDLESLTREIIQLKQVHFPSYGQGVAHWHDWIKVEVKGANLRRALREGHRDSRRHMMGFLDQVLSLLERHGIRLAARVYVKQPKVEFKGASVYSSAIQRIAQAFEDSLMKSNEKGVIVLDSRNKVKNVPVSHGLFTWNFSSHGSAYHYLAELPLFGHSENHALIQLADWVGSAFLAPMATTAYCAAYKGTCVHVAPEFDEIRDRFGQRIKKLQYRFEREGRKLGGIHVLGGKDIRLNTLQLFGDPPAEA